MSDLDTSGLFAPLHETIATAPAAAEEDLLRAWRERGTFEAVQRAREGAPAFVFWEGPPTANGRPGIHHILARTIKDSVCRFQTMRGKRVVRKAGWDTHGLPVELEVEKKLGISGKPEIEKFGIARFNEECRKSVWTYRKEWEELSERSGYWLDYAHPYVTYEPEYVESIWYLLKRFHDAGLVYHGRRVLPYCGRCGTGLSSHELGQPGVYRDELDPSIVVRFRLAREPGMASAGEPESFLAWTTTPWTLPSNFALALHPSVEYVRARVHQKPLHGDAFSEILWVAAARAEAVLPKGFEVLERRTGSELAGVRYQPLFEVADPAVLSPDLPAGAELGEAHRVVTAEFVTTEDGTGIVHQAPYGVDDWEIARKHRLAAILGPGSDGRFVRSVFRTGEREVSLGHTRAGAKVGSPVVEAGTWFKDADAPILEDLKARHLLFKNARENHSYPHCWRCDTPLFYFPSPAWYIRTTAYKQRMIEHNRRIRWIPPEVGEKRFGEWLENNVDWNISRDRYWGTPLPFWTCDGCGATDAIGSVAELRERAGSLPEGFDSHKPAIDGVLLDCARCGAARSMKRTRAVLDCWFDSGAMPYAQYGWPNTPGSDVLIRDQFPADFIAEGLDQTRGWFYTLHAIGAFATSLADTGLGAGPTYRTCVVNGLVLDKDGVKMSKRLGNVVDPWKAIAEHGADAVRWYLLASGNPWLPKRFDPQGLVEVRRRFLGTLTNSYRFFAEYARIDGFDPRDAAVPEIARRPEIDRWLASRTESLTRDVSERMEAYDLAGACRAIEDFVVDDLSNWYIRRNRRRFWKSETGSDKLAAFATLHAALVRTAELGAPFAPFLSEMLWERLSPAGGSVHAQLLAQAQTSRIDDDLEASMRVVTRIVEMGRALRERARLRVRQPLRALHVRSSDERGLALLGTSFAADQVLDELNIKAFGSLAADDGRICSLRAKANFRSLGKRLGARMKAAARAIEELPGGEVARLRAGASVTIDAGGEPAEIGPDDVQVVVETRADFDVETDGRYVVWIDTTLDEALVAEGLAREVVSRVNSLRKEAGLAVEDRIRLRLDPGGDALLTEALRRHRAAIAEETLAAEFEIGTEPHSGGASDRFDLDGRSLGASLLRT